MQSELLVPITKPSRVKIHPTKLNLWVDTGIFAAFLLAGAPRFTGLAVHEWISLALGAMIVGHLLLHWQWIAAVTRRFFDRTSWQARVNYVLNAQLFVAVTIVIFTGVMISEAALPALGLEIERNMLWRQVHGTAADLIVLLVGLHVALHWRWIANSVRRYVVKPMATGLR